MAEMPEALMPHRVAVATHQGNTGLGDSLGAESDPLPCMWDESRKLVRDANGQEVVADVTLILPRAHRDRFTFDSAVRKLPGDRVVHVLSTHEHDDGGLGAWQHLEVVCHG